MGRARGVPKIWDMPKNLGGVVAATTVGKPIVESNISVNIPIVVRIWITMQGNIEQ